MRTEQRRKRKKYTEKDLTIVICAYKECSALEKCIQAIMGQTKKAHIMISTSTPNEYIHALAEQYGLKVYINKDGGHVKDYNFAMEHIRTRLGMLAHQDDILHEKFVERNLEELNRAKHPILAFSNYLEMHDNIIDKRPSTMIRIKRLLTWPARIPTFRRTVAAKRLLQCFGNPITHPTVVCVMEEMPKQCFRERFRAAMDWDLWERLSQKKGEFVYVKDVLLYHRMNKENATAVLLESSNVRFEEEYKILCRFWPKPMASFLMRFYSKSAKYY